MKILHIISSGGMYGAEAVILNMSRTLNEGLHRSMLGVFSNSAHPNTQLQDAAAKEGIAAHPIACEGQVDRAVPGRIRALVQQTGADVVHAHGYKADVYAYFALRGSRTPLVSTCHTWYDNDLAVRIYGAVDRFVLRSYAGVVAVSEDVRRRLLKSGVAASRIRLIQNGIDLRPFALPHTQEPDHPLRVGLVGRLAPEKGVDLFLQAAAGVLAELPSTQFSVVGDGPDRVKLEVLIESLGISGHAALLGRCDTMPAYYASLDVLVSASRQEGLPIALLEGMASRLPLVATAVGAVSAIVRDGRTGLMVPAEDIDALKNAMITLLRDSALRARYGEAAQQLVADEFSSQRMTQDYLQLYEDVVSTRRLLK